MTGLREEDIGTAAQWIGESPEFTTFWTMGLNQSTHGTWHTNAICNLHLATGKICRPGSGPFSLTGQPNAMGGREVGYLSHALPGQRAVTNADDRAFVEKLWGVPAGTIRSEAGTRCRFALSKIGGGRSQGGLDHRHQSRRLNAEPPARHRRFATRGTGHCAGRVIIRPKPRATRTSCCPARSGPRPRARW